MLSTIRLLAAVLLLTGCVSRSAMPGPVVAAPALQAHTLQGPAGSLDQGAFAMADGARLPYRAWLPESAPRAVVLALHGFNDSRDAWELPAPVLAEQGIAVFAPDQRGFGAAPGRGLWPGTQALVDDARTMAGLLRARFPRTRLVLMGESMGGAVVMCLAASASPPPVDGYVLAAPAVWGRAKMNLLLRTLLFVSSHTLPGLALSGNVANVHASDNHAALVRLSTDPLTIHRTRLDTLRGLVDLMDAALAAAPHMPPDTLFLYGGKDEVVPPEATAATWHALPRSGAGGGPRIAFYPDGYHLLLRDHDRAQPTGDVAAWILGGAAGLKGGLPSGAGRQAAAWLAHPG